jgi:hypothetical protein
MEGFRNNTKHNTTNTKVTAIVFPSRYLQHNNKVEFVYIPYSAAGISQKKGA